VPCALKICGVTRPQDIDACCELGVDAIGINLWRGSPRGVALDVAAALIQRVPTPGPAVVAVVVDPDEAELHTIVATLRLDAVQLHGTRDASSYPRLSVPHVRVVRGTPALTDLAGSRGPAPRWILLDAAVPGFGGRGVVHDWDWAAQARAALAPVPVWLAGGLDPGNAARAIDAVAPHGIDVASGAEDGVPGEKSRSQIAALRSICDRTPNLR
jgi:phosphoribosylanthranilate isomerase